MGDLLFDTLKCTAADKKNIFCIDRDHLLFGVFAAALGRDIHNRTLEQLEKALLNPFA